MTYRVFILRTAQRELGALPHTAYERVKRALKDLACDPRPAGCAKLIAREGWRIREGDYRIIYDIDDSSRIVTILHIGHRRDVYR